VHRYLLLDLESSCKSIFRIYSFYAQTEWTHNEDGVSTCFIYETIWRISMALGAGDLHENCLETLTSVDLGLIQSLVYIKFKLLKKGPPYNKIVRHEVGSTALWITNLIWNMTMLFWVVTPCRLVRRQLPALNETKVKIVSDSTQWQVV
jgi:hypothetical protein